jgi:hypothetical protein
MAGGQAVLYGGLNVINAQFFTEVWLFDFDEKAWKNLSFSADSYNAVGRDKHAATMYGCSRLVERTKLVILFLLDTTRPSITHY